ncbi:MAG: hypothetical protein WD075_01150 [Rhodospirillales bacterium]
MHQFHRKFFTFLAIVLVAGGLVACRSGVVYNVVNDQFTMTAPSLAEAEKTIKLAGASLGWQVKQASPGKLIATLPIRTHVAIVDITHDTKQFSIMYKDSTNLDYDGTNIHSNYNGWIQNLQKAIVARSSVY